MANAIAGGGLAKLALPVGEGRDDHGCGVEVGSVVDDVHVVPGLWKIDAYGGFCSMLAASVGLVEGENFHRFAYDWRRDNRLSAIRLANFAQRWLSSWRMRSGNVDARIVLVAHSMGGLVARRYVECLDGWRVVRRLFTIGTPHRGSLDALGCLVNGYAKGIGPLRVDATAPLRSFPSVYQLLPTFSCVVTSEGMVRVQDAPLEGDVGAQVRAGALDAAKFHAEIREAAEMNRSMVGYPSDYLSPIASARQPTFQSARPLASGIELLRTFEDEDHGGDGTVPMVSAVPHGIDASAVTHVWGLHSRLVAEEGLREHVLGALRAGRVPMERFRSAGGAKQVRLELEDACEADVTFELAAAVDDMSEQTLSAEAVRSEDGMVLRTTLHRSGRRYVGPISLPEGAWRVAVRGTKAAAAEDLVLALRSDGSVAGKAAGG
ncbi:esterase/lipase family protein [Roseomonas xinghualingensis]|uniref:esterase/lipase family protein n=1 Tax=Roseomonas xinghualingensis TaxID=2986475 RepID=UPI0021F15FD3|nr:hypothetical protein [Roseomonas sp. SXEYE001]MCV4208206.1 hypothetical protein [Roseomonas sp. SXEYE001]